MTRRRPALIVPIALLLLLLTAAGGGATAGAAEPAGERAGLPLAEALDRLRAVGLALVYSDRVVTSEMRVELPLPPRPPRELAETLLAAHGLGVEPAAGGWLIVVRREDPSTGRLEGRVVNAVDGTPVCAASVRLRPAGEELESAADGGFHAAGLPPGDYELRIARRGFVVARVERVRVRAGATATLEVALVPMTPPTEEIVVRPSGGGGAGGARLVSLPVNVWHEGRPVRGLAAENFRVLDGGRELEIVGFETFDLDAPLPTGADAQAIEGRRHVVILFDLTRPDPGSLAPARAAAATLVRDGLEPVDLVSVAAVSALNGARMMVDSSRAHTSAARAIARLGFAEVEKAEAAEAVPGPVRGTFDPPAATEQPSSGSGDGVAEPWSERFEAAEVEPGQRRSERSFARSRAVGVADALGAFARRLAERPGRKQVILLSDGLDSALISGLAGHTAEERRRIEAMNRAAARGRVWEVDESERYGNRWALAALRRVAEEFRRADCTLYAVDLGESRRGARALAPPDGALFLLADETGGRLVRGTGKLGRELAAILETTRLTYVLTLRVRERSRGGFRRLKVRLRGAPRGAHAGYRPGYHVAAAD